MFISIKNLHDMGTHAIRMLFQLSSVNPLVQERENLLFSLSLFLLLEGNASVDSCYARHEISTVTALYVESSSDSRANWKWERKKQDVHQACQVKRTSMTTILEHSSLHLRTINCLFVRFWSSEWRDQREEQVPSPSTRNPISLFFSYADFRFSQCSTSEKAVKQIA